MEGAYEWLMSLLHKPIGQFTLIDIGALLLAYVVVAMIFVMIYSGLKK